MEGHPSLGVDTSIRDIKDMRFGMGMSTMRIKQTPRRDATRVASLLYLVLPVTALMAWLACGETLAPLAIAGMALTAMCVALVAAGPTPPDPPRTRRLPNSGRKPAPAVRCPERLSFLQRVQVSARAGQLRSAIAVCRPARSLHGLDRAGSRCLLIESP